MTRYQFDAADFADIGPALRLAERAPVESTPIGDQVEHDLPRLMRPKAEPIRTTDGMPTWLTLVVIGCVLALVLIVVSA